MTTMLPLKKMSREDKLRAMEELWADLSSDAAGLESPEWHAAELHRTEELVAAGKAKFHPWEEAKARLLRKAAKVR